MALSIPDLSPLEMTQQGSHLRFTLATPHDILPELPANFEHVLQERLAELLADPAPLTAEIDLQDLPGLSSRQLGALLAVQKVLRARVGPPRITNVSGGVRHLLALTHVDRLFELA